jgi:hypothetical protein
VRLVEWNEYLQAILAMEDWDQELDPGPAPRRGQPLPVVAP